MDEISLEPLYSEPLKISYEKYIDMQSFSTLVPPNVAESFRNIPHLTKRGTGVEILPDDEIDE